MRILVTDKLSKKHTYSLSKEVIIIGRGKNSDVVILDSDISRSHAQLELKDGKYFVQDLGAANGVFINQERLKPHTRTEVSLIFPIFLGPNITVELLSDEEVQSDFQAQKSFERTGPTHTLPNPRPTKSFRPPKKKQPVGAGSSVIVALVIGGIVFFQISKNKKIVEVQDPASTQVEQVATQNADQQIAEIEKQLTRDQKAELKKLAALSTRICKDDNVKSLCQKASPPFEGLEGAVVEDSVLKIYRNLRKSTAGLGYTSVPEEHRHEVMMINLALRALGDGSIKAQKINTVEVIDFMLSDKGNLIPRAIAIANTFALSTVKDQMKILGEAQGGNTANFLAKIRPKVLVSYFVSPESIRKDYK